MATNLEFDSLFFTALKLLHSNSKSSSDQLKALLDEALSQKTDKCVTIDSIKPTDNKIKEPQKRPAKQPVEALVKSKKSKSHSSPSSRNPSPEPLKVKLHTLVQTSEDLPEIKKEEDSDATDIEENPGTDASELALEMGLVCVVCKRIDFSPGNQQVECSECHNLYHQECHKPPITDRDVSDPRNVWYCAKCTKNLEKMSKKNAKGNNKSPILTSSASFQSAVNSGRETAFQLIKAKAESAVSGNSNNIMQPFKRVELKIPQSPVASGTPSSSPSTPTKPVGLAGFAANLNRTTAATSTSLTSSSPINSISSTTSTSAAFTSTSSTSSSSTSIPTSASANMSKADKRIQQMKKKAANKKIHIGK